MIAKEIKDQGAEITGVLFVIKFVIILGSEKESKSIGTAPVPTLIILLIDLVFDSSA